jgi:hypothetical protein
MAHTFCILEHRYDIVSLVTITVEASHLCTLYQFVTRCLHWTLVGRKTASEVWKSLPNSLKYFNGCLQLPIWRYMNDMWFCCTLARQNSLIWMKPEIISSTVTESWRTSHRHARGLLQHVNACIGGHSNISKSWVGWKLNSEWILVLLWRTLPEASKGCRELIKCVCKKKVHREMSVC